jgi:hypothetical protein
MIHLVLALFFFMAVLGAAASRAVQVLCTTHNLCFLHIFFYHSSGRCCVTGSASIFTTYRLVFTCFSSATLVKRPSNECKETY